MHINQRLFCSLLLLAVSFLAKAEPESLNAIAKQLQDIKQQQGPLRSYEFIKQQANNFDDNAEYDYLVGVAALEAGLNNEAILALERSVLMQPNFAGAWLDLSIAYYRTGQIETAQQLIQHIEENFQPPENLLLEIQKAKKLIRDNTIVSEWRSEMSVLVGRVRNANFGISTSTLQLTLFDGGVINAQLSPDLKPRADTAYETRFATSKRFKYSSGAFSDIQLAGRAREYNNEDEQSFIDLAGSWNYLHPLPKLTNTYGIVGASYRQFMLNGKNLGDFTILSTGIKKYFAQCGASIRHEHEMRNYQNFDLYDATIPWLALGADCYWNQWSMQLDYRYGWDDPDGLRAGGTTKRQEMSAIARWDINPNLYTRAIVYYADYQDQQGYSPLIANGANRYIHRVGQRLELSWKMPEKIGRGWYGILELDNIDTHSNIALSRYEDTQLFAGIRYQFY